MIEISDPAERDAFLRRARGIERHLVLEVGPHPVRARWDETRVLPDQASAVMYVKFPLTEPAAAALRSRAALALVVDHPEVTVRAPLDATLAASLAEDVSA
jgi:hypothetical protein